MTGTRDPRRGRRHAPPGPALVWLADRQAAHDWARWSAAASIAAGACRLVSADPAAIGEGRRQAGGSMSLWRYVQPADQVSAANEALELASHWPPDLPELRYRGADLLGLCRRELLYLYRDALLARRMADGLFAQVPARLLYMPAGPGADSVLGSVLRWAASSRSVPVAPWGAPGRQPPRRPALGRAPAALSALVDQARLLGAAREAHRSGQPTIALFGGGADYANQLPVAEALRRQRPYNVLHVALGPVASSAWSRSGSHPDGRRLRLWPYLVPTRRPTLERMARLATAAIDHPPAGDPGDLSAVLRGSQLRGALRSIFELDMRRAAAAFDSAGRLLSTCAPQLVMLNNAASPRERAIVAASRQRGIRTVQWVHSGVNDLHVHGFACDELWAWGERHRTQFTSLGAPSGRIRVIGNPNYDGLAHELAQRPSVRAALRHQLGVAEDHILFLLMTAHPPRLLSFVDAEAHIGDLEALCRAISGHESARLVIKPHPRYDDPAIYRALADRYEGLRLVEHEHLDRLLAASDVAVILNAATTGGLEALLQGLPLLLIRCSARYPDGYAFLEPGSVVVGEREAIAGAVERLLRSPEARRRAAARGQDALPGLVASLDGRATATALEAIDELVAAGGAH